MKIFYVMLSGLIMSLGLSSASAEEKWDMPMAYAASNFHSEFGALFAEAVGVCTGGEMEIVVHPGGSLFGGTDIKRAVQTGQVFIGERILSSHSNEEVLFGLDSVPFLATSFEDSDKLWKHLKPELEKVLYKQNLVLLYSVPWPPQGLYFKKDINSVDEMKGIKFRSYNTATARLAELSGMLPVQIEAAELTQALATGVAESFVSSGSTGYDRKVWDQLSNFYDTQAWLPRNYVFANRTAFNKLSSSIQNCFRSAALLTEKGATAKSNQLAGWYLTQLAANGMKVQPPSDRLKADLAKIGKVMTDEWMKQAGAVGAAVVAAYQNDR